MSGWRGGRSEGAQSRPQSIFEEQPNPTQALGVSVERRSLHEQRGCLAKATLPRRWMFRVIAEAGINNAVALQRQPYQGVGCFG